MFTATRNEDQFAQAAEICSTCIIYLSRVSVPACRTLSCIINQRETQNLKKAPDIEIRTVKKTHIWYKRGIFDPFPVVLFFLANWNIDYLKFKIAQRVVVTCFTQILTKKRKQNHCHYQVESLAKVSVKRTKKSRSINK